MEPATPISRRAIQVGEADNVAVARRALQAGERLSGACGTTLELLGAVTAGHRFALRPIADGELVLQYGQPIGTSLGIAAGEPVTRENLSDDVPVVRELPDDLENAPPDYLPPEDVASFEGYRRPDGRAGTRNFVLVVPTSMCAAHEARHIALTAELTAWNAADHPSVDGVVAIPHNRGCGSTGGAGQQLLLRTLAAYADHPNVGGIVVIGLGCEMTNPARFERFLSERGGFGWEKPVEWIGIQEAGGTKTAIDKGVAAVAAMLPRVGEAVRERLPAGELVLGVKCGGSDGFSGISANPALGRAADLVVRSGGTVLITEVPEFSGAEHLFARRARNARVGREVLAMVDWYAEHAATFGGTLGENPSPGNVAGGLLNITIKSLGAMAKAGSTRVEGVCDYAGAPARRGLHLMQGPGYDQESTPGLVGAGANVVVFTTGRGTTIGNAICPVVKLASNTAIFERMKGDLDLSAGSVLDGTETLDEAGERIFDSICRIASKETLALAEENGHREFGVWGGESVSL
ncbi:MAG: galactonate dehydratase [Planctomycetes bacterium]|jgi:altronate dehydratase|nr:galactonate dehydratase [Planctomycetota bacterium]MDP6408445.1 altronate dehydratase family protein [Planctomycetota bacterium]